MSGRLSMAWVKDILANRAFSQFMAGNFLSLTGEWAQRLAVGWIAESTGLRWPVAGGGLLCVLVWLWVVGRLPNVRSVLESGIEERSEK